MGHILLPRFKGVASARFLCCCRKIEKRLFEEAARAVAFHQHLFDQVL